MAAKVCIHMEGKKTTISNPAVSGNYLYIYFSLVHVGCFCQLWLLQFGAEISLEFQLCFQGEDKDFSYDFSYWSADSSDRHFASQEQVYLLK